MADAANVEDRVLRQHARAIVHMRGQLKEHRFGLVFGAGIGQDIQLPSWEELVGRIANHPRVAGQDAVKVTSGMDQSHTIGIQKLFEWYRSKNLATNSANHRDRLNKEKFIIADWRSIVVSCLYATVDPLVYNPQAIKQSHPYLGAYEDIIRASPVTINYNFDQTLQILLSDSISGLQPHALHQRNFRTISRGRVRSRRTSPVIYHPNGFLAQNLMESTDQIVFTEESFADQLLDMNQHKEDFLLHHFSNMTCLFIGISLNDANLKHLLRQNASVNPGQCHYYVCFDEDGVLNTGAREAIRLANFQVYNLVTLFMGRQELAALGRLLSTQDDMLRQQAETLSVNLKYVFYMTGPMGVGKSTCLSHFYSATTLDEWTQERLPALAKDRNTLEPAERDAVDEWLRGEFYRKNWNLSEARFGVIVVDRPPLDPLAFTDIEDWRKKAQDLRKAIVRGKGRRSIQPGYVILLTGDPHELYARIIPQNKESSIKTLKEHQAFLEKIYEMKGVRRIDTRFLSVSEVVKRVSSIIHLQEYEEADLDDRLKHFADHGIAQGELVL